jgi:hydroxymethylpyrimidine pyrophosphatase-like HAD family hydrolase
VKAVLALDLDQTLIFSARSAEPLDGAETVWVEDYLGEPLSLMTLRAHDLLAVVSARHHVVPVTTRTPEQFGRVRLPGRQPYAICANGGILLQQGIRDPDWDARVAEELTGAEHASDVAKRIGLVADQPWVKTFRQVEDLFVYVVAHARDQIPDGWLQELAGWAAGHGWTVSVQGRKVYVVPNALSKGAAAQRVADLLGGPLLAAGDSLLDRDLLESAVVRARPGHGELHRIGYHVPGLYVSAAAGARAAEQILAWLTVRADAEAGGSGPTRPADESLA